MMPRLLILIILMATLLGGCARNRYEPPKRPDSMLTSASGKRVVINDENGQPTLKIRARKNAWKVYDESFQAAGFIRWSDNSAPHVENLVREKLAQFKPVGENGEVFELAGHLRIEKIVAGWAVFDQHAKLLGLFEHDSESASLPPAPEVLGESEDFEDFAVGSMDSEKTAEQPVELVDKPANTASWTLRTAYNTPVLWTATQDGKQVSARFTDGKTVTVNAAQFSAPALLAGEMENLSALERAALAAWFNHMMPGVS